MKHLILAALVFVSFSAKAGEAEEIEAAKQSIVASMKDPESAQFRNLVVIEKQGKRVVCGEVNAKNAFGGYVGFRQFYSVPEVGLSRVKQNDPIMDRMVDIACRPPG